MTTDEARLMLDSAVSACCGPDANNAWAIIKAALADATQKAKQAGWEARALLEWWYDSPEHKGAEPCPACAGTGKAANLDAPATGEGE